MVKKYNSMEIQDIIKKEECNDSCIYFYVEKEDVFVAYEASAYILTQLYPSVNLRKKHIPALGTEVYIAEFDADFCRRHFLGSDVLVDNDVIKVVIADETQKCCKMWIDAFSALKVNK